MNCIIPGLNVKALARAIQALAKIGEELFIEAKAGKLTFLTFNQSKTVCGQYRLLESFFSIYCVKEKQLNEKSAVSCKIHMKTLLPLFRGTHLEKKLEFIKIEYEPPSDTIQFKIKYKTDEITVSHILHLLDPEILSIEDYSNSRTNGISAGSGFYNNLLSLFSSTNDDITLEVTKNSLIARNYYVGGPHRPKSVRSQVNLNRSEFSLYKIMEETTINFSLKPLRTAILFAEVFGLNVGIDFDKGGRPLSVTMKHPTFEVMFIVATINPYADGQCTTSLPSKVHMNSVQHNLTHEDLEAIANENWDEFEADTDKLKNSLDKDKENMKFRTAANAKEKRNIWETVGWDNKVSNKGPKQFILNDDCGETDFNKNKERDVDLMDCDDVVATSPESPKTKKARLIFKRSYDLTFHPCMRNNVILKDSDSE